MNADPKHVVTNPWHLTIVVCICLMSAASLQAQAQPDLIVADVYDTVSESNEKNNSRTETWICDVTPPQIIQGPQATDITETSASIV
ncbi:MAG TPA: hypothetical protein VLI39_10420 [Sedimentisphaerales bacterium]|nr:hypothetical protein [Sedimentisphaerales bacterium]